MVIKHSSDQYDYNLEIDYNILMGGWSNNLKDLLHRESMSELMFLLNTEYKNRKSIYPAKKDIFNCLKETAFKDINVVIVNCVPNLNARSNGLAFGNIDNSYDNFDSELVQLFNDIENYDNNGLKVVKDYTLTDWAKQGVLLLNVALTRISDTAMISEWRFFINYLLKYISDNKQGVIFLFVGDSPNKYQNTINLHKHNIYISDTLSYDSLNDINLEIDYVNGRSERIKW
jgi:uracil-DNA glycosylase